MVYGDPYQDLQINLKKGLKRAEQCKMYLVGKGIAENRIITDSKGELAPKYDNKTFMGRAQNRRVEIINSAIKIDYQLGYNPSIPLKYL